SCESELLFPHTTGVWHANDSSTGKPKPSSRVVSNVAVAPRYSSRNWTSSTSRRTTTLRGSTTDSSNVPPTTLNWKFLSDADSVAARATSAIMWDRFRGTLLVMHNIYVSEGGALP